MIEERPLRSQSGGKRRRMPLPVGASARLAAVLATFCCMPVPAAGAANAVSVPKARELHRFLAPEAVQGVAVDRRAFFAIDSRSIGRYDKKSGLRTARWADVTGGIVHLNSCEPWRGRLYCAQSNYPHLPMTGSIEIFDAETLARVGRHDLGRTPGSLTWASRHGGRWWLCFANYDRYAGAPSAGTRATTIVEYDAEWRRGRIWKLPASVLKAFAGMSASGGAWGPDGYLYVAGHDRPELYVLSLPDHGPVLASVATIRVPGHGQAFGWDPGHARRLYTIDRQGRSVIASLVPRLPDPGR